MVCCLNKLPNLSCVDKKIWGPVDIERLEIKMIELSGLIFLCIIIVTHVDVNKHTPKHTLKSSKAQRLQITNIVHRSGLVCKSHE